MNQALTALNALIPSSILVPAFFPMLGFFVINGMMLYWLNAPFRAFAVQIIDLQATGKTAFLAGISIIAIAMLAKAFSALLRVIQNILEGNWPQFLVAFFSPDQVRRLERLEQLIHENDRIRVNLDTLIGDTPAKPDWSRRLTDARNLGVKNHSGINSFTNISHGANEVSKIERLRRKNERIDFDKLNTAIVALTKDLEANDITTPNQAGQYALQVFENKLARLVGYAVQQANSEDIRLNNLLRASFGTRTAPTLMGNVSNTIQSYADGRYSFNFEFFWSRLLAVIPKESEFAKTLENAKTQLEFLLCCCCLTFLWSLIWIGVSIWTEAGRTRFLLVSVCGPVLAYVWYRVAVAHYQNLADLMRTAIDLHRFKLLEDLHISLPIDVQEENGLWDKLHRTHSFYESQMINYSHKKSA